MTEPDLIAAVDLGSNSFHMVVARHDGEQFQILDKLKDRVRLGAGLDDDGALTDDAAGRALACLARFGQRLRDLPEGNVRAVGTNTLRRAKNSADFLARASEALGHPIAVIAGREEARLIYQGVSRDFADPRRRLVVDIGGGSTELILGDQDAPQALDSLYMGCVSWSMAWFPDGRLSAGALREAITGARLRLQTVERRYRSSRWAEAVGSSGTIKAVEQILHQNGFAEAGITAGGLSRLREAMIEARTIDALELKGLQSDRRPVLAGGVAILSALFEGLRIQEMAVSQSALREGLLLDLVGRRQHRDVREETIARMERQFEVDTRQADRLEAAALSFSKQTAEPWDLDLEAVRPLLRWAARLHEVGISISGTGYHKHGAYLITHSDMPGFSLQDKRTIAAMVLAHRGNLTPERLARARPGDLETATRLSVLLRLAARLHRDRSKRPLPPLQLEARPHGLRVVFPSAWVDRHPLTRADLESEREIWAGLGLELELARG